MSATNTGFDWNQVRAFLTTVETGSLSAAARKLGSTQPTLSRQVAALEADLGVMLFERVGRSLSLTQSGRELLEHVKIMGEAADMISLTASGQHQSVEGLVRIAASDMVAAYRLPGLLEKLFAIAPGIEVEVVVDNQITDLMRREADIALRHVQPDQPGLVAKQCATSDGRLYASSRYLDQIGRPARPDDLASAQFVALSNDDRYLGVLQSNGLPVSERNVRWRSESIMVAWEMVKKGLGIGMMISEVGEVTTEVELVLPELEPLLIPMWLVAHRELYTSRRMRLVFDMLTQELAP